MIILLAVFGIMTIVSFVSSLLDGVLVSASIADVELLKQKSKTLGRIFERYQAQPERALSAVLALDTFVSTVCASLIGAIMMRYWSENIVFITSIFITIFSFVFTDILPKTLGIAWRRKLLPYSVRPIQIYILLMYPICQLCSKMLKIFLPHRNSHIEELSDESLILTAKRGVEAGILSSIEGIMLEKTLTLDDTSVKEIAQFSKEILDIHSSSEKILKFLKKSPLSRIPIYDGARENIVGFVFRSELWNLLTEEISVYDLHEILHPVLEIDADAKISTALELLLKQPQQIAVVRDSSQSIGFLSIENIFEYVVGRKIFHS